MLCAISRAENAASRPQTHETRATRTRILKTSTRILGGCARCCVQRCLRGHWPCIHKPDNAWYSAAENEVMTTIYEGSVTVLDAAAPENWRPCPSAEGHRGHTSASSVRTFDRALVWRQVQYWSDCWNQAPDHPALLFQHKQHENPAQQQSAANKQKTSGADTSGARRLKCAQPLKHRL